MSKLLLSLALAFAALTTPAFSDEALLAKGREHTETLHTGDPESLWPEMTAEMQQAFGTPDALQAFRDGVAATFGAEETLIDENALHAQGYAVYIRTALFQPSGAVLVTQWAFDAEDKIAGFFIQPRAEAAESRFLDYEAQADLRLPFDGEWFVFWGGRTVEENYHAANTAQRFALDLVVVENGVSHTGDPDTLENYLCWGREILAPASGTVVAAINDLPDQPIGASDPENPAGNHVILDLGNDEYVFLAHLQHGSVTVIAGDTVAQGDVLGLCGNSGNTSEPHLHIHMQTTPDLYQGEGLPMAFNAYTADGQPVERGEPVQGQIIAPR